MKRRNLLIGVAAFLASVTLHNKAKALFRGLSGIWQPGQRPFLASSLINTPLNVSNPLIPMNWPPSTGGNYYSEVEWFFDLPASNAANVAIDVIGPGWGNPAGTINRKMSAGIQGIPDGDLEVVSIIGNDCLSIDSFTNHLDGTGVALTYAHCDLVLGTGFGTLFPFAGAGVYATGQCNLAGALLKEEAIAQGAFNHMIAISLNAPLLNGGLPTVFYDPAISGDGSNGDGLCQEGQVLAIPKTTPMPSGMDIYSQMIFTACQNYGAFVSDQAGDSQWKMGQSYQNGLWTNTDLTNLITNAPKIMQLLQKVGCPMDGTYKISFFTGGCAPYLNVLAYTGNCLHVTRDSDSTGQDVGFTTPPQSLLNASAITSFCAGTTGRVSTYYDGFGGFNLTSAGDNAPIIYQSGALVTTSSGNPAMLFDGSTNYMRAIGSLAQYPNSSAKNVFLSVRFQISDYAANYGLFGSFSAGGLEFRIDATTGFVRLLKNGSTTIALAQFKIPLNVDIVASAHYNADGSYAISLNKQQVISGSGSLVAVTAGDLCLGAGGPAGTELFKGKIGGFVWFAQSTPGPNTQYSIESGLTTMMGPCGVVPMAADNFVGSNGTDLASHTMDLGTGWANEGGGFQIQSNSAQPTASSGTSIYTFAPSFPTGTISATLTGFSSGGNSYKPGLIFWWFASNFYFWVELDVSNNQVNLYANFSGTVTLLETLSMALTSGTGYVIAVTVDANNISFTVNGANKTTYTTSYGQATAGWGIISRSVGSPSGKCSVNSLTYGL